MTLAEAQAVAEIIAQAHGGCGSCYGDLVELAQARFGEFEWTTTNQGPMTASREEWEALWAAWEAEWPAGSTDEYGDPCPVRVRPR